MDVVGGGGMLRKGEGETRKGQDMRERERESVNSREKEAVQS